MTEKINYLKKVITETKRKYQNEWEKIKGPLMEAINEFRDKLRTELKEEVWKEAENKFTKVLKTHKLYKFFGFNVEFQWEKRKNLFEKIKNLAPEKKMYGILKELAKNKKEYEGGKTYRTIMLTILYPEWYFPVNRDVLKRIKKNLQNFPSMSDKRIDQLIQFYQIVYEIKEELGIDTMLEVGFYLFKYNKEKSLKNEMLEHNKETDNKPTPYFTLSSILNALQTKPFLILAGISGTGKTQIARLIAGIMCEKEDG